MVALDVTDFKTTVMCNTAITYSYQSEFLVCLMYGSLSVVLAIGVKAIFSVSSLFIQL